MYSVYSRLKFYGKGGIVSEKYINICETFQIRKDLKLNGTFTPKKLNFFSISVNTLFNYKTDNNIQSIFLLLHDIYTLVDQNLHPNC